MCALLNLSIFGTFTEQLKTKQNQPTKITIDKKYIVRYIFFFVCSAKKLKKKARKYHLNKITYFIQTTTSYFLPLLIFKALYSYKLRANHRNHFLQISLDRNKILLQQLLQKN